MRKKKLFLILLSSVILIAFVSYVKFLLPIQRDNSQWDQAAESNSVESYDRYLQLFENGRHAEEAKKKKNDLLWKTTKEADTIRAYENYIHQAAGNNVEDAKTRIGQLQYDDEPFLRTQRINSIPSWENFLLDFPGHYRVIEAKAAIAKLRGTLRSLSEFVLQSPNADSKLIDDIILEISNILLKKFPPNQYNCNINLNNLKQDMLTLIQEKKPIIITFFPHQAVHHSRSYWWNIVFYNINECDSYIKTINPSIMKAEGTQIATWRSRSGNLLEKPIRIWRFGEEKYEFPVSADMLGNSTVKLEISGEACQNSFTFIISNTPKK